MEARKWRFEPVGENVYSSRTDGPCERHNEILNVIADHESRLRDVEKLCGDNHLNNKHIFLRLDKIDKGLEAIALKISSAAVAIILLLAGFFVWYVKTAPF